MADKDTKDEEKGKVEEEVLTVVTDETPAKDAKGDDDADADDEGDDGKDGDERLGASDSDVADDTKGEDRRKEHRSRRQRQREARDRLELENKVLREHNRRLERTSGDMAKRLDNLEGVTIDGRINQFKAAISKADDTIADAVSRNDGDAHKEATKIRDELKEGQRRLEAEKERTSQRGNNGVDPEIVRQATAWAGKNGWFDPRRGDEDSAIAGAIDDRLMNEGRLDPRSPEYYEEFDRRLAARGIGGKSKRKQRSNGHDRDDADLDDDDDRETREGKKDPPQRKNGGPKFRGGGGERTLGPNQVYLSKQRLEALAAAGIEEGTPEYKRMLKRYKDYDNESAAR